MSLARRIFVFGLIILASLGVIVVSSLVSETFFPIQNSFFGRPPLWRVLLRGGFFGRHLPGLRGVVSAIGAYFFLYLTSVLALFVFPSPFTRIRSAFSLGPVEWLRLFAVGLLAGLSVLLLGGLGLVTGAAFPLPFLLLGILLLAVWVGLVALAQAIGEASGRLAGLSRVSLLLSLAIGLLVMFALGRIPLVGWVFTIVFGSFGLGAVVTTHFGQHGMFSPSRKAEMKTGDEVE